MRIVITMGGKSVIGEDTQLMCWQPGRAGAPTPYPRSQLGAQAGAKRAMNGRLYQRGAPALLGLRGRRDDCGPARSGAAQT